MKRTDLIKLIAQDMGVTFMKAQKFVKCFEKNVTETLVEGDSVSLLNFGCLKPRSQKERLVRNPKTGTPVMMTDRKSVV